MREFEVIAVVERKAEQAVYIPFRMGMEMAWQIITDMEALKRQGNAPQFFEFSIKDQFGKTMMYMLWGQASAYSENLKMEINKGIFMLH